MDVQILSVSPEVAKTMLHSNTINRSIRARKWKKYSQEMKSGYWKLSHQGIAFSKTGKLLDGQHRLLAVIDSGMTLPFMVTYGLDESLFSKIDVGFLRTASEVTKIPSKELAIVKFFASHAYRNEIAQQSEALIKIHAAFKEEIQMLDLYCTSNKKIIASAGVRAAAVLSAFETGSDRAFQIYRDMCLMNFSELPPVALNFVKQSTNDTIATGGTSGEEKQVITFIKACEAFDVKSKNIKIIKIGEEKRKAALDRMVSLVIGAAGGDL